MTQVQLRPFSQQWRRFYRHAQVHHRIRVRYSRLTILPECQVISNYEWVIILQRCCRRSDKNAHYNSIISNSDLGKIQLIKVIDRCIIKKIHIHNIQSNKEAFYKIKKDNLEYSMTEPISVLSLGQV